MWDPTSSDFSEKEASTMNCRGDIVTCECTSSGQFVITLIGTCADDADITDDANFFLALKNEVEISRV